MDHSRKLFGTPAEGNRTVMNVLPACRLAALNMIIFMLSCNLAGCTGTRRVDRVEDASGPGDTVVRLITLANQGLSNEAALLADFRKIASFDADFSDSDRGGWSGERKLIFWDTLTMNKGISKIRILSEKVTGDFAIVKVMVVNNAGEERQHVFDLEKKETGGWMVIIYYKMVKQ